MCKKIDLDTAKTAGLTRFFTGEPCRKGHVAERYVSNKWCVICNSTSKKKWSYKQPPERKRSYDKQWASNNPELRKATKSRHLRKLKMDVLNIYGNKCECCGESEALFLTIDHVNNDGKYHRKDMVGQAFYRYLRNLGVPDPRFQILCFNCNIAKSLFGSCPHARAKSELVLVDMNRDGG